MSFSKGRIVAFSGIDGAGKSTQIELLLEHLKGAGKRPVYFWSRGGYTGPFNALKEMLRRIMGRKLPPAGRNEQRAQAFEKAWVRNVWLTLAMLDLIFIYGVYFRLLRLLGRIVIADRYLWDTWIDFRLNFPEASIDHRLVWKTLRWITPKPDVAFFLLIPIEESLRRSKLKNEPFPDSAETLQRRLELYETVAGRHHWLCIDCRASINSVQHLILDALSGS